PTALRHLVDDLDALRRDGLLRDRAPALPPPYRSFCSNDYLGFAAHGVPDTARRLEPAGSSAAAAPHVEALSEAESDVERARAREHEGAPPRPPASAPSAAAPHSRSEIGRAHV